MQARLPAPVEWFVIAVRRTHAREGDDTNAKNFRGGFVGGFIVYKSATHLEEDGNSKVREDLLMQLPNQVLCALLHLRAKDIETGLYREPQFAKTVPRMVPDALDFGFESV